VRLGYGGLRKLFWVALLVSWLMEMKSTLKTGKGVSQGDPLSPLLFNLVGDALARMLIKVVGKKLMRDLLD
jgi:hypothetical protein